jgi:hypothetical protein
MAAAAMHRLEDVLQGVHRGKSMACLAVCAASVVEFGNAANLCRGDCSPARWAWAVAVGVVSFLLVLLRLGLFFVVKPERLGVPDMVLGAVLVVLWSFGAGFNLEASVGVFSYAGNGFFATWIALLASVWFATMSLKHQLLQVANATHLAGKWSLSLSLCAAASLIEMAQGADLCRHVECNSYNAYAVALGAISLVFCVIALVVERNRPNEVVVQTLFAFFLVGWWAIGAGVNTSTSGAFPSTLFANGYFFTWIAFAAATIRLASCLAVHFPPHTVPPPVVGQPAAQPATHPANSEEVKPVAGHSGADAV